jgi:phage terminase large subunit-like protein
LAAQRQGNLPELLAQTPPDLLRELAGHWGLAARDDQLPPPGDWTCWLMLGGRGAGKTRAGAEWTRALALGLEPYTARPIGRIALVGETFADVRDVMIEGPSGLLSVCGRADRPRWEKTRRRLVFRTGAIAQAFSAEDPEALRGPQFGAAWCDEIGKWREAEAAWDMLQFGLRLGDRPRQMATTTPRPVPILKRLLAEPTTVVTHAATEANKDNLARGFMDRMRRAYGDSRLGRQELMGELIDDRVDALWRRADLDRCRVVEAPDLIRIVVAVDPPASSSSRADRCGIVAAGLSADGIAYVLADATLGQAAPDQWARRATGLYRALDADSLVAEVNMGGEMVAGVVAQVDPGVPVRMVRATRGKWLRAEPVAALYAAGRVRHVGAFAKLEDEMADFGPAGLSTGRSPDRLDALVWALTELLLGTKGEPRVRRM